MLTFYYLDKSKSISRVSQILPVNSMRRTHMHRLILPILIFVMAAFAVVGQEAEPLQIVTTTTQASDLVTILAGDLVGESIIVTPLMGPGVDPPDPAGHLHAEADGGVHRNGYPDKRSLLHPIFVKRFHIKKGFEPLDVQIVKIFSILLFKWNDFNWHWLL